MLIDGNALVYRSFYGLPPLSTKDGIQVNAVYGFASSIFHAIEEFKPKYICVAFDVSKKTWRNKEYPEYKANRIKAPQELYDQLPLVKEVCQALNIPQFGVKDYEADDVIGTVATSMAKRKTKSEKLKTIIVTGDMDTLQLVNDSTEVYSVSRGIKRAEIFNEKKVREKYGFDPKYLVDYKALRGDPSDNIPGVSGIGEKTATSLIQNFGSIENLYHLLDCHSETIQQAQGKLHEGSGDSSPTTQNDNVKLKNLKSKMLQVTSYKLQEKTKELLLQHKSDAFLSKRLATISKNVSIDFQLAHCKIHDYNKTKAEKLFRKLEFKSLIRRLPEMKPSHKQESLF